MKFNTPSKLINNDVSNVVTRSSHKVLQDVEVPYNSHDLENTFMNTTDEDIINIQHLSCNKAKIIIDQQCDETLKQCYNDLVPFEEVRRPWHVLLSKGWSSYEKIPPHRKPERMKHGV